jgi:GNAT superfamily N-acetyltransferase
MEFDCEELKPDRLSEVLALIRDVFLEYEAPAYSDEGMQEFMRFIELKSISEMLAENKMKIWMCEYGGEIIGALAADKGHIFLMFVKGQYHRKGIARNLLDRMIEYYKPETITVNSSPYAVEAYRRLGFVDTDKEQIVNGLRFTPMKRVMTF